MRLEGYHNTEASNIKSIFEHGFLYRHNDTHWLGQGIYFFADFDVAAGNADMLAHEEEIKTISVEIVVEDSAYCDLDRTENLNDFRKYCGEKIHILKESGKEIVVKGTDKRTAMLKYRCFFMDMFKMEKNYAVVSKTFSKENTPYAEPVEGISYLGLPFLEKYLCVGDNKYIVKMNVVEKEWLV